MEQEEQRNGGDMLACPVVSVPLFLLFNCGIDPPR
jgi:hypothetical protein